MNKKPSWKCDECGTINQSNYLNCINCAAFNHKVMKGRPVDPSPHHAHDSMF